MSGESPESPQQTKANGMAALLTTLAQSPHQWVQLVTVALIAVTGIGNWVATWNSADRNKTEIEISRRVAAEGEQRIKAEFVRQVSEIHSWMHDATDEFHRGNADSAENRKMLAASQSELVEFERRQTLALDNQTKIIRTQNQILEEIHQIVEGFDKYKKLEQMRGAPP